MGEQVKMLIIEQELTSHENIRGALNNGVLILSATNVAQSMEVMKRVDPQLIVINSRLPESEGIEILRSIKKMANAIPEKFMHGDISCGEFVEELKEKVSALQSNDADILTGPEHADQLMVHRQQDGWFASGFSITLDVLIRNAVDYNIRNNVGLEHALRNFKQMYFDFVSGQSKKHAQGGI